MRNQEQYGPLSAQWSELERQIQNHIVNLSALGCEALMGTIDLSGTRTITQGIYAGWLTLTQRGTRLTGFPPWQTYGESATVMNGTFWDGRIEFVAAYPTRGTGEYRATVDPAGKTMRGQASGPPGSAPWTASKVR